MERTVLLYANVKGYHECPFKVTIGEKFHVSRKTGERGDALRVYDQRGQLGHIQKELVGVLWPLINAVEES